MAFYSYTTYQVPWCSVPKNKEEPDKENRIRIDLTARSSCTSEIIPSAAFDRGADPDVRIDVPERDGVLDYSAYFDIDSIGRIMDEIHPEKEEDAPSEIAPVLGAAVAVLVALLLLCGILRKG